MKKIIIALTSIVISFSAMQALAEGQRGKPPAEAFEACEGKSEGDTVSITSPQGDSVEATCKTMRGGDELVAMPAGGPPKGGKRD